jgi:hypothetical protein
MFKEKLVSEFQKFEWKSYRVASGVGCFGLGFIAAIIAFNYAIDWPNLHEGIIELSKASYLKGCVEEGQETDPSTPHFKSCHIKGEFYSADVRWMMYQAPKILQKK